ncbi:hypothetical protein Chor_014020 [Crotalus horridus]
MPLATFYFVLPLMEVLFSAEVIGLLGGDHLDCVKASDQCLREQSCSTKYRTLRQCVAGKESNFSRAAGLEAKDECKSAMEALKQKSLYNCRCKRGMKKEKNCLRIYWSMYQSLQGPPSADLVIFFVLFGCRGRTTDATQLEQLLLVRFPIVENAH